MCGISGIINKYNSIVNKKEITEINNLISHRGPDDEGFFYEKNFAFGHRRLSILDLSSDGHQPMHYLDEKYTITYNGEVYNYLEIKEELIEDGYIFKSHTDTEVILASYNKWGQECVNKFNGMWAFAIYDKEKEIIFCSRDRFGIKPFYYTELDNKFVFGSEIKQFTVLDGWKAILNTSRGFDFLEYGLFDHTNETLFKNVFQLRGGHNLIFDLKSNNFEIIKWYELKDKIIQGNLTFVNASKQFNELFEDAVKLRLRSDVKVGSCLSGGLDSSSIVCTVNDLLKKEHKDDIQETVSSCFDIKKYDEQEYIDEVTKKTNTKSNKIFPKYNDLFKELEYIVWHQDEPFGSTSIFAQWSVFKEAKKNNLTVMLDGQGADEYLAGYHGFYSAYFLGLLKKFRLSKFIYEIKAYKINHNYSNIKIIKELVEKLLPSKIRDILRNKNAGKISLFNNSFKAKKHRNNFTDIQSYSISQVVDINLPMLLHYEDRDSMAFSIESRVPFLDYRLVEFVLSLPDEYKINNGETKSILREAMRKTIPSKIKNRQDKMGFVTPEEMWIKENKEIFLNKIEEYINLSNGLITTNMVKYFKDVVNGTIKFDFTIWRIIIFGEWMKKFKVEVKL
jgi:asparagine synthase (glutamine-hydrolysing)